MSFEEASKLLGSRTAFFVAATAGILLAICLVIYFGISEVWDALATAGWSGMAAILCAYLVSLLFCAWSWRVLLIERYPLNRMPLFLWARWIRDSIGNLLAIVPGAGEAAGARELSKHGIKVKVAAATTIVDMTTEMLSQLIYTFLGLAFLFAYHPDEPAAWWAAGGLLIATIAVVGFLIAQKNGLIPLSRDAAREARIHARLGRTVRQRQHPHCYPIDLSRERSRCRIDRLAPSGLARGRGRNLDRPVVHEPRALGGRRAVSRKPGLRTAHRGLCRARGRRACRREAMWSSARCSASARRSHSPCRC